MKRSQFLRTIGGLTAGAAIAPAVSRAFESLPPTAWPGTDVDDAAYWAFVREQFPLTRERAYLNTGGLGASPFVVIDAVTGKMAELERISETGHSEELLLEIKGDAATLLGCDVEELAFVRNTTEGINIVANGLAFARGDEIITTTHEHVGNAFTWLALAKREGVVIRMFEPSVVSEEENLERIRALITKRTKLLSIPHAVTTTGLIMPVARIGALAREKRLWFFVDGAQTAGMFPFSLHDIGCDAYATSGHKWLLGPKETGFLYVRKGMLDAIRAKFTGAHSGGEFDFLKGTVSFNPSAQRYEYGTINIPLRCGLGAALKFINRIGIHRVWAHDRALATAAYEGLRAIPGVTVHSPAKDAMRSAMIAFSHASLGYLDLQKHLDTYKLRTRGVSEGGMQALRISFHVYNTPEEVARVIEAVRTAPKG
jgi:selenocysteine lyase/cysteine desulfurase